MLLLIFGLAHENHANIVHQEELAIKIELSRDFVQFGQPIDGAN